MKKQPFLMSMMAIDLLWSLGGGGVYVIVSLINNQRFGNNENILGIIYATAGIGTLLAARLRPWLGKQMERDTFLLGFSCVLEGVIFMGLVMCFNPVVFTLVFMVRTAVSSAFGLIYYPILLKLVDDDVRGRVLGFNNSVVLPAFGLAAAFYGALLNYLDVVVVGFIAGGIMMSAGVLWLFAMSLKALPGFQDVLNIDKKII